MDMPPMSLRFANFAGHLDVELAVQRSTSLGTNQKEMPEYPVIQEYISSYTHVHEMDKI